MTKWKRELQRGDFLEVRIVFTRLVKYCLLLFVMVVSAGGSQGDGFYEGFVNPPAEARPFVRWWWNGDCVNETEIIRELEVLKAAGFGGVEINPVGMKEAEKITGDKALVWLSPEWNRMLKVACDGAHERGMIADLIVGAGWPFGGRFLKPEQRAQRLIVQYYDIADADGLAKQVKELFGKYGYEYKSQESETSEAKINFIKLIPADVTGIEQVIDLKGFVGKDGAISYNVQPGKKYKLAIGVLQRGYQNVANGAPGADGPTMDHYKEDVMPAYLNRLRKIESDTGVALNQLVRALFCDSIELKGSNWSDDMAVEFRKRCGYDIEPWLAFVLFGGYITNAAAVTDAAFNDKIERVRYDYSRVLADVFNERFTAVFQKFCTEKGVLCRYQAYGHPWLMGISQGYQIPDIPEGNTWLFSEGDNPYKHDEYVWNKEHGFMIWNKYAAAGGHLMDRRIISCEAATNTSAVFQTTLSIIKQSDDMNFITGINHSIVHGFNYSPLKAGLPGLVKYGSYFSEQNTWWPHVNRWVDYNARLSYVFQNSQPVVDIAVMGPTADVWSKYGLERGPFHTVPWYLYEMWQRLSQNGTSCDYIDEAVLQKASFDGGKINYGPMAYKALIVADVRTLSPETAGAIKRYVESGGKVIFIGQVLASKKDVYCIDSPGKDVDLLRWTKAMLGSAGVRPYIDIDADDSGLYQIYHKKDGRGILFFVNSHRLKPLDFTARLEDGFKKVWRWDPETGNRSLFSNGKDRLLISLGPLESILLVMEGDSDGKEFCVKNKRTINKMLTIDGSWEVEFNSVDGSVFKEIFAGLTDFGESGNNLVNSFAGEAIYKKSFNIDETGCDRLDLGNVNEGITEVMLNGKRLGARWYGEHVYDIKGALVKGENELVIKYTTILINHMAKAKVLPSGIVGPVCIGKCLN